MPETKPRFPFSRKPKECSGCQLFDRGHGFVRPDGPLTAPILLLGEAPGYDEAAIGKPFIGAAGSMLERILRRNRLQRGQFRIGNVLQCVPPGMMLDKTSYQYPAIAHCAVHRDPLLNEGHPVVMAAGMTALKTLLGLHGAEKIRVEDFHGTVNRDPEDRFWVVPTFHPSHLQRGAANLIGTVSYDLQVALELVAGTWQLQPIDLVIDPPVEWFRAWVEQLEAAALQDPEGTAVSCDIETPDKASGKPENELTPDDDSYQVTRYNFACHPDQGVTVPNDPAYYDLIGRVLAVACFHYWWNGYGYDWARIAAAGHQTLSQWQLDLMVAAHVLQSDVPLGLGFWAPFYSHYGPWKHFSATDPEKYACLDGPQTQRCGYGIIGDLIAGGQWRAFQEDCHELYYQALKPAQDLGILIDRPALEVFHEDLTTKQRRLLHTMQGMVPSELRPLTFETRSAPEDGYLHPQARTTNIHTGELLKDQPDPIKQDLYALAAIRVSMKVRRLIQVCTTCGQTEVHKQHRCKRADGTIDPERQSSIVLEERDVVRWFWQEPFNPDSPKQMLAYIKFRKHKPGKSKITHEDSADRETLIRLSKSTRDPFYQTNLDYRAVKKVDSTYAIPTMRRVDGEIAAGREPRLHPIPTFRPSMGRLSYVSPNITNVVQDKGGKQSLAAGFRRCVVAAVGCRLLEVDYSGIEAVDTGYFSRDPAYIRLAKLGVHAFLASHLLGRPADLRWSDVDLLAYFKEIKAKNPWIYDQAKRCLTGDHEILTPTGWVRFDEYVEGIPVAQWDTDGSLSFVRPSSMTRIPFAGDLLALNGRSLSAVMTPDHRIPMAFSGGPWRVKTAATLPSQGHIPTGGILEGDETVDADFLRLIVAVQADGTLGHGGVVFHFAKARKTERLCGILDRLHADYTATPCGCHSTGTRIRIRVPLADQVAAWLEGREKLFHLPAFLRLTTVCRATVIEELQFWDGHTKKAGGYLYFTSRRGQAERVQTLAATLGRQALLREQSPSANRFGRGPQYVVSFNARANAAIESLTRMTVPHNGTVYCLTVPTSFFLIRHRDRISVTGNCVHGTNYGLTPFGMVNTFPDLYPDLKAAEKVQRVYFEICPSLPVWHNALRQRAYDVGCLGGPGEVLMADDNACYKPSWKGPSPWPHPFQYRHWFWSVLAYKPITESQRLRREKAHKPSVEINGRWFAVDLGDDAKRCVAFYPQSTAAGTLKRSIRALLRDPDSPSYIGDAYYGKTPFRAPIHDSLLLEVPDRVWDRVVEKVCREMLRPIQEQPLPTSWNMGSHLTVGVEAKAGKRWQDVEGIQIPGMVELGLTEETAFPIEEAIDGDDLYEFGTVA